MNKKKIGELDGVPVVTGGKNCANENEYYMTLNGDNTYKKLEQRIDGNKFRLVLGSGSSNLPPVTANDENKVLQVIKVQTGTLVEHAVIVPEQTLSNWTQMDSWGYYTVQNVTNLDKFVAGATATVVINGETYTGDITKTGLAPSCRIEGVGAFGIYSITGDFIFEPYNDEQRDYSISVSIDNEIPQYEYQYQPGVIIPQPTAEDVGKVLTVVAEEVGSHYEEDVFVPQQTVTTFVGSRSGSASLSYNKPIVVGELYGIALTDRFGQYDFSGEQATNDLGGVRLWINPNHGLEYTILYNDGTMTVSVNGTNTSETFTIKVYNRNTVVDYNYEWQAAENTNGGNNNMSCKCRNLNINNIGDSLSTNQRIPTDEEVEFFNDKFYIYYSGGNDVAVSLISIIDIEDDNIPNIVYEQDSPIDIKAYYLDTITTSSISEVDVISCRYVNIYSAGIAKYKYLVDVDNKKMYIVDVDYGGPIVS